MKVLESVAALKIAQAQLSLGFGVVSFDSRFAIEDWGF